MRIEQDIFGQLPCGEDVERYRLTNAAGIVVDILTYGATITRILTPNRQGKRSSIVLGYDTIEDYLADEHYIGRLIGRVANRIAHGRFQFDGQAYQLDTNQPPHHLHGGRTGFSFVNWKARIEDDHLILNYQSPHGKGGYPGHIAASVSFRLTERAELQMAYSCKTDRPTVVNMTRHEYFNLNDSHASDILDHEVMIDADQYTPTDDGQIPTGVIVPVTGALDFRKLRKLEACFEKCSEVRQNGYDHNFVLNKQNGPLSLAAICQSPASGRKLEVFSTQPGLMFYTGSYLDRTEKFGRFAGLCFEPQHFPDTPNQPAFPSVTVTPDQPYEQKVVYRFSCDTVG